MEFFLRTIPNDYSFKKEYLDKNSAEIETLILGSSHAYYGFNPIYFSSKTFNGSHISQSFDYDYEIFQKYQCRFKNLKTIVLPISYFSIHGKLEEGTEAWRVKNYVIYYDFKTAKKIEHYSEVLSHPIKANVERLISFNVYKKSALSCSELGWGKRTEFTEQDNLLESGKSSALRHTYSNLNDNKLKTSLHHNIVILKKIVEQCKIKNIKILFLTLPAYKSYRENLNKEQLDICLQTGKNLQSDYTNVIYLNLLADDFFNSEDFQDADHLSSKGAEKLSKVINRKIEQWN
jgi:hypothetical protein